jgi:hypothetical protein
MIGKRRKSGVGRRKFTLTYTNPYTSDFRLPTSDFGLPTYDKYQNIKNYLDYFKINIYLAPLI